MESVSFDLVFTASFSETVGGADFSSAVDAAATALGIIFENEAAKVLNVTVSAELNQLSVVVGKMNPASTTNSTTQALATRTTSALNVSESLDVPIMHLHLEGISGAKMPFMSILVFLDVLLNMRSSIGIS